MEKKNPWYKRKVSAIVIPAMMLGGAVIGFSSSYLISRERVRLNSKLEKLANTDNKKGLSFKEEYIMREAMGIEDSSNYYPPSINQLKKGITYFENK